MLFVFDGLGVRAITARESVCCQEIDKIKDILVGDFVPE